MKKDSRTIPENKKNTVEGVATWEETFMDLAQLVAKRSKDPNTKVGACIVSVDDRVLSLGYNGAPKGLDDRELPWQERDRSKDCKYHYVVHAERNAVLNYRGYFKELSGASIFVTHSPCLECTKEIVQSGLKKIYYRSRCEIPELEEAAKKKILAAAGVEEVQLP